MNAQSVKESRGTYLADAARELVATASESSFDATTFFEKFTTLANAENTIATLRGLVLELAFQGRCSQQLVADGDAADLIKSISKERAALSSKYRIPTGLAETDTDVTRPNSWQTTTLGFLSLQIQYGFTASALPGADGIRMLRITDIQNNQVDWSSVPGCKIGDEEAKKYLLYDNDILIARTGGTIGKSFIVETVDVPSVFASYLIRVTPSRSIDARYLKRFLETPLYWKQLTQMSAGTGQPNVNGQSLSRLIVPLPPLAEQKRIVAKVDELMGLCDRLEALEAERKDRHASLSRAALARFAASPTPTNLQFLFHKSYDIAPAELRKSILTLAVQGKLVPQDPNDEPAEELLTRLARELTPEQRRRQAGPFSPLSAEILQYEIPDCWKWVRFREVAIIASKLVNPKDFLHFVHLAPDNIEKGNGVLLPCRTVLEDKVTSSNHRFYRGQIIYSKIRPNLAKVVVVDFEGLCSADMYPIDAMIDPFYLQRYMLSESFLVQAVKTDTRVAMPKINQMELNAIAVPIPPLAEQKRIVAKVDQLMALVDQLEQQLAHSRTLGQQLLEAVVAELTKE